MSELPPEVKKVADALADLMALDVVETAMEAAVADLSNLKTLIQEHQKQHETEHHSEQQNGGLVVQADELHRPRVLG